jgi:hypothetical protein
MLKLTTIKPGKLLKGMLVCLLLVGAVVFAFASKGGGGEKKKNNTAIKADFKPIRTISGGFTLRSGPAYGGTYLLSREKDSRGFMSVNTLVTYQKGNTVFIQPYRYRLNYSSSPKSNLQLLDLKIQMHK